MHIAAPEYDERNSGRKLAGIGMAALFHVALVYALMHGLGAKVVAIFHPPVPVQLTPETTKLEPQEIDPPPVNSNKLALPDAVIPPPDIPTTVNDDSGLDRYRHDTSTDITPPTGGSVTTGGGTQADVAHTPAIVDFSSCTKPEYPRNAARSGQEGTVTLQFLIGANGRVVESRIDKTSGSRELDRTAQQALSQCQFTPATVDGRPQQSWTSVQYVWRLD